MAFVQRSLRAEGFGAALRELRELRGFSRDSLGELTKIHSSVIAALEEDRICDLKDPVYAERHIRALVMILEGRPGYFLEKYHELLRERHVADPADKTVRPTVRRRDFFVTTRFVGLMGFAALILLAGLYLFWQTRLIRVPPKLVIESPADGMVVDRPRVEVRGRTDSGAVVFLNGDQAVVEGDGTFRATLEIPRGVTLVKIQAKKRYGTAIEEIRRVTYVSPSTFLLPDDGVGLQAAGAATMASSTVSAATATASAAASTSTRPRVIRQKRVVQPSVPSAGTVSGTKSVLP